MTTNTIPWGTAAELAFIEGMGKGENRLPAKKVAEGYLKGIQRRVKWGFIDRQAVMKAAKDKLAALNAA